MYPTWRIELFGGLRAVCGETVVTRFRTQKSALLLAHLALACAGPRRQYPSLRDELACWLWPDSDTQSARTSLRHALTLVRRVLEPDGVPPGSVLIADRATVRLNPEAVTTDVAEFEVALQMGAQATINEERARCLIQALDLYRGELLAGYYEPWIVEEQGCLSERYFGALAHLLTLLERAGELGAAVEYARRGTRLDPLREEAHRDLMRLLAAAGQPAAALRQYDELERLLARDLAEEPSDEVRALADALRKQAAVASTVTATEPAPRAPSLPVGNLPLPLDRFFGRRSEMARLIRLLRPPSTEPIEDEDLLDDHAPTRLVTLTGPGGSGKTRLALEVARRLRKRWHGAVWFVPLQGLTPPSMAGVATGTHLPLYEEIRDALGLPTVPGADLLEQLVAALAQRPTLLILDNFEHLVEGGAPLVQALLQRAETVTLLVASRRRLNLLGEQELPVPPLPVPTGVERGSLSVERPATATPVGRSTLNDPRSTPSHLPSVALFIDRARHVRPDLACGDGYAADIARLCARLEGIPLAIELAAGRAGVLTPRQMLERLDAPFDLLVSRSGGAEPRHRSLRAALEWSYQLLPPALQQFFCRLSIFRGGWTLAAAEAVCDASDALDCLEQLRECSLVIAEEANGEIRYRLLETLREYGAEQLTSEEQAALARRHAEQFLAFSEQAEQQMHSAERYRWMERLDPELDNFRAALTFSLGLSGDVTLGMRLASALTDFWQHSGHTGEGREWLHRLLDHPDAPGRTVVRAKAIGAAGLLAAAQYDAVNPQPLLEESIALRRELGDTTGMSRLLYVLGRGKVYGDDLVGARPLLEEAAVLARECGDRWDLADALGTLAVLSLYERDRTRARKLFEECRSMAVEVGAREIVNGSTYRLGHIAEQEGRYEQARELYLQSMAATAGLPAADDTCALRALGRVARLRGDLREARARLEECLALRRRLGHRDYLPEALYLLAMVVLLQGDYTTARSLANEMQMRSQSRPTDPYFAPGALRLLARIAFELGDLSKARLLLDQAWSYVPEDGYFRLNTDFAELLAAQGEFDQAQLVCKKVATRLDPREDPLDLSLVLRGQGGIALQRGDGAAARRIFQQSLALLQQRGVRDGVPSCLEGVALALGTGGISPDPAVGEMTAAQAARLLGAAEALREAMGAPLPPVYRPEHECERSRLRAILGEHTFVAALAEGRSMPLEQAVAEALVLSAE